MPVKNFLLLILFFLLRQFTLGQKINGITTSDTGIYHPQYKLINEYLLKYKTISDEGGWPTIKTKDILKPGIKTEKIIALRKRLISTDELKEDLSIKADSFDLGLEKAVRKFQENHGLTQNGKVDAGTLRELNISVEARIRQLELNRQRWQQLAGEKETLYVFVNAAAFSLEVIENNSTVLDMKVVVGKLYRRTPVFTANLTSVRFNPFWFVPPNITKKDVLPEIKNDPGYLIRNNMMVLKNGVRINADSINWDKIDADTNPYKFAQRPGYGNPMGVVMFLLPNKYNVFLHDTPSKKLFEAPARSFSSGCIRLSKAIDLANYLLKKDKGWEPEKTDSLINSKKTLQIELDTPVKVYVQYFTAWVNTNGTLQFVHDIYKRDY